MESLPKELQERVLQFLDGASLVRFAGTCRFWKTQILKGSSELGTRLWRRLVREHRLGEEAEKVFRPKKLSFFAISFKLHCLDTQRCCFCFESCRGPQVLTDVAPGRRPICVWAKEIIL